MPPLEPRTPPTRTEYARFTQSIDKRVDRCEAVAWVALAFAGVAAFVKLVELFT